MNTCPKCGGMAWLLVSFMGLGNVYKCKVCKHEFGDQRKDGWSVQEPARN